MDILGYIYAVAITVGGIAGYVNKGSLMSGVMGLVFGVLAFLAAYRSSVHPRHWALSLLVSVSITGVMGSRFFSTGKVMPAGMVAVLSLLMVLRYGHRALTTQ